jgi:phosphatidylserine decarboxylase
MSRAWGFVNNIPLPRPIRTPIYTLWARTFSSCRLDEAADPLDSYPNLAAFFSRPLKPGVRTIDPHADLVSPVDGHITVLGEVIDDQLEQIKGVKYKLQPFLGTKPSLKDPKSKLYYCVIYLSPGEYHRIHSASDCSISKRIHFPGTLFPVRPWLANHIPSLFSLNERVALNGQWKHGFFSMSCVGAYNVGSIKVAFDPELQTNKFGKGPGSGPFERNFSTASSPKGRQTKKGEEVAKFELGSTVVLVFESKDFLWNVKVGDFVQLGKPLGWTDKAHALKSALTPDGAGAPVIEDRGAPTRNNKQKQ